MTKKQIQQTFLIGLIFLISVIAFLYYNYKTKDYQEAYLKDGGFKRHRKVISIFLKKSYDLQESAYAVVALKPNGGVVIREYQGNKLITFNPDNTKSITTWPSLINHKNTYDITTNGADSTLFDLQNNNDYKIYTYNAAKNIITSTTNLGQYYDRVLTLKNNLVLSLRQSHKSNDSLKFRISSFDNNGKENLKAVSKFSINSLSEDGMLKKNDQEFVYINYYNHFVYVIDTNLNKKFSFKTVDTISTMPKTVSINNNTIIKFLHAPRLVNRVSCVDNNKLFINSLVKGDNNTREELRLYNFLDIYNLKNNGAYEGTIYIDKFKENNLTDFLIKGNTLILIYPDKLLVYEIKI